MLQTLSGAFEPFYTLTKLVSIIIVIDALTPTVPDQHIWSSPVFLRTVCRQNMTDEARFARESCGSRGNSKRTNIATYTQIQTTMVASGVTEERRVPGTGSAARVRDTPIWALRSSVL